MAIVGGLDYKDVPQEMADRVAEWVGLGVPIAGDSVVMEHYFDSIEKSPISKFIVSKITVK